MIFEIHPPSLNIIIMIIGSIAARRQMRTATATAARQFESSPPYILGGFVKLPRRFVPETSRATLLENGEICCSYVNVETATAFTLIQLVCMFDMRSPHPLDSV